MIIFELTSLFIPLFFIKFWFILLLIPLFLIKFWLSSLSTLIFWNKFWFSSSLILLLFSLFLIKLSSFSLLFIPPFWFIVLLRTFIVGLLLVLKRLFLLFSFLFLYIIFCSSSAGKGLFNVVIYVSVLLLLLFKKLSLFVCGSRIVKFVLLLKKNGFLIFVIGMFFSLAKLFSPYDLPSPNISLQPWQKFSPILPIIIITFSLLFIFLI